MKNQIKLETFEDFFNSKVIQGSSKVKEFCSEIPKGNILVITTKSSLEREKVKTLIDNLDGKKCEFYTDVEPNPDLEKLDRAINSLNKGKFNSIIAIGGGSVMDSAKAIMSFLNLQVKNPLSVHFREGKILKLKKEFYFAAVPTTSGTGSEATPFSTIWDFKYAKKYSLESKLLYPDLVFLNPEVTSTLPFNQTLFPGLDATSHALEAIWNRNTDNKTIEIAENSLRLIVNSLPHLMNDLQNSQYRSMMQEASFLAGIAISRTKTAIAHSISYPLTSKFNVPHGIACSFTLASIIDFLEERDFRLLDKALKEEVKEMLENLNLNKHLNSYINNEQILSLIDSMYSPERAKNFYEEISHKEIKDIVNSSLV